MRLKTQLQQIANQRGMISFLQLLYNEYVELTLLTLILF